LRAADGNHDRRTLYKQHDVLSKATKLPKGDRKGSTYFKKNPPEPRYGRYKI